MIKLTREQVEAASRNPEGVECEGEGTDKVFVIVDAEVMRRMKDSIGSADHAAIQAGIEDMEADRLQSAEQAHRQGREELTARFQQ